MAKFDRDVLAYYEQEREEERLTDHHPLERLRTQALLKRWLPPPPATVLDVGGGPGVHAAWLAGSGYRVRLFDPVPRHVAEASRLAQGRFGAELAEARSLPCESASADAVLLFGPLYHLPGRDERLAALAEAVRVCRPGGLVACAAITPWAGLFDLVRRVAVSREDLDRWWAEVEATGSQRQPTTGFTTAHFHRTAELRDEMTAAGLVGIEVLGVEGIGAVLGDEPARMADPLQHELLVRAAEITESEPDLAGLSAHLLAVGRVP